MSTKSKLIAGIVPIETLLNREARALQGALKGKRSETATLGRSMAELLEEANADSDLQAVGKCVEITGEILSHIANNKMGLAHEAMGRLFSAAIILSFAPVVAASFSMTPTDPEGDILAGDYFATTDPGKYTNAKGVIYFGYSFYTSEGSFVYGMPEFYTSGDPVTASNVTAESMMSGMPVAVSA